VVRKKERAELRPEGRYAMPMSRGDRWKCDFRRGDVVVRTVTRVANVIAPTRKEGRRRGLKSRMRGLVKDLRGGRLRAMGAAGIEASEKRLKMQMRGR